MLFRILFGVVVFTQVVSSRTTTDSYPAHLEDLEEWEMYKLCTMRDCTALDCFHRAARCNSTNYLAVRGKQACDRMWKPSNLRLFNREAQAWMRCWNKCQISFLGNYFEKYNPVDCSHMEEAMLQSSIDCHISCGFCAICKDSRIALLKMMKMRSLSILKREPEFRGAIKECGGPSTCSLPMR